MAIKRVKTPHGEGNVVGTRNDEKGRFLIVQGDDVNDATEAGKVVPAFYEAVLEEQCEEIVAGS